MIKKLLTIVLLFTITHANAQKDKGGYFSLRGGMAFKDGDSKGIGHLSVGVSPNHTLGIGLGVGVLKFDNTYIPLTVDISLFGKPGKISPVIIGSAGYGVYKYNTPYFTVKGGFTGSLNAGGAIPVKGNTKLFLTAGYAIYSFDGGKNIQTSGASYSNESSIKMFTITAGVKI